MGHRLHPLETSRQIETTYKRYLKTLLAPRDSKIARAFDEEIDKSTLLTKGPLLEITPPYETGATIQELIDDGILHNGFGQLKSDPLPLSLRLYAHQEIAIRKLVSGRNLVISTGTGSGKTESFLVPILNSLVSEHAAGTLGPGVRALFLYPMNALANDQLKRLRKILAVFPAITFGRYTGETSTEAAKAEAEFLEMNPGDTRLPNELLSRDEMRRTPPHILLTNYAMLEYLLLRPADIDLFDGPYSGTWRFIVLDEAHVYDGAQGSEVALLLRRLRQRVAAGRALQCVATSASLEGSSPEKAPDEAMTFAHNLFHALFEFVHDDPERQDLVRPSPQERRPEPSWELTDEQLLRLAHPDADLTELAHLSGTADIANALHAERKTAGLKAALADGPVEVQALAAKLWPGDVEASTRLESLVTLGSRVRDMANNPVISARYHMFVRATEGAFVSFSAAEPRILLGRHLKDPVTGKAVFEFGTCLRCGAVHLAGDVHYQDGREYFVPSTKHDASVKWLVLTESEGDIVIDEDELTLAEDDASADAVLRYLCTGCGYLADNAAVCSLPSCPGGELRRVRAHRAPSGVMSECTECGARARQVIRRLRTDVNAAPAVVTTALYQQLPAAADRTAGEVGNGRKLLMFSDSRQAAAFAAPYLNRTYGRLLERRYLTQALQDPKYSAAELTAEDLAILTRRKAEDAGHFAEGTGRVAKEKAVNEWVIGELITMDVRQSLEGLGLMSVSLHQQRTPLPRAFSALGLSHDESWAFLDELVKTARLQGAMTVLDEVDIKSERFEPRNARIRMRSIGSDRRKMVISWRPSGRAGTTNSRITYVRKVLSALGISASADAILGDCWDYLAGQGFIIAESDRVLGPLSQINHRKLSIRNGLRVEWYRCSRCRRLTAFSVRGVCPTSSCDGVLQPYEIPSKDTDTNHYRVLYQTMGTAPLSAKEHTAQWDAKEAATIQRDFIDGRVNVLSCSTTFELGVDVGDLESVVMRNMPPKTANYVQRAGRAGRRPSSAALVVTYANRASHDLAKYQDPRSMIAGRMRIPWVPIDNERIGRRHAHSVALAAFFRHWKENERLTWKHVGAFFSQGPDGQDSPASRVQKFLTPVPVEVKSALRSVLPQSIQGDIGVEDDSWVVELSKLLEKAEAEVRDDVQFYSGLIEEAIRDENFSLADRLKRTRRTIEERELIGFLANRNVLPKYGFPVDTVELRTLHCPDPTGQKLELERDLSLAIYEYAPGNEVVAGGKIWTSRGLRKLPRRGLDEHKYRICQECNQFQCGHELDINEQCPSCGDPYGRIRTLVLPEFGFVADRQTRDVGTAAPERLWRGGSYVENVGDKIESYPWPDAGDARVVARAGARATLWVISEGDGQGFDVCEWCGWAEAAPRVTRGKSQLKSHPNPQSEKPCDGRLQRVSLGHRYQSDVAEFTFSGVPYRRGDEDCWRSALYAMIEGASEELEISRDDIDGALSWSSDRGRSIVLFDTVPGGAGAAKRIAENIDRVLKSALNRVVDCDCGQETSCYGCLRSYRNRLSHEQLSRDGALRILSPLFRTGSPLFRTGLGSEVSDS